jgi:hypothetical protein
VLDDERDEAVIDDSLDLLLVSSCYIGQEPNGFLKKNQK